LWVLYLFKRSGIVTARVFVFKAVNLKSVGLEFVSYCSPLFIYSAVGLFAGLFDIWLLQTTGGAVQTGYYGLAYSLAAMCFIFTGAMTPIITREFSKSYEQKDLQTMRRLFDRYIPMLYSIAAYFAVFISFQSANILELFTDEKFADAYWVLVVMGLYPIHQTYGQLSGSIFYATGQTKLYRNIGITSMFVGLLLTLVLIYLLDLQAVGLAFKMIISQLIGVNIQLYFNVKLLGLRITRFVWHQFFSVAFFAAAALVSTVLIDFSTPLVSFLVSGFVYTLLVVVGVLIYPEICALTRADVKYSINKAKNIFSY